jgi:hypothetical protein
VNDLRDRCGGVDRDAVLRNVFFRLVQSRSDFPMRFCAPVIFRSLVKPPVHGVEVDFEDKNAVKEIYELCKIPRATAEEMLPAHPVGD